ncbi:MAG: hypothetical protein ABEJ85_02050 [Haloarculaceae archaeon]
MTAPVECDTVTHHPGEFAGYFRDAAEILPVEEADGEAARALAELHDRYDLEVAPESVPELVERHGLDSA